MALITHLDKILRRITGTTVSFILLGTISRDIKGPVYGLQKFPPQTNSSLRNGI